ncbi:NHL repeat-containing protein [Gracilimonas halophila]|uniref:TolB-like 6-blade propeller-like n=1 Tax=Gracilimonas halophila TaxID=1834464 RepID=A0ABW5JNK8_9BACT
MNTTSHVEKLISDGENKMLRLIAILTLVALIGCEGKKKPVQTEFTDTFKKNKEIDLEPFSVYEIRYLDINSNNDLLITNRRRTEVFLFDSLGKVKTRLSEELSKEFPGANWKPYQAYFTANDEIFVANGAPWGIWFNRDGSFKKMMPKEYWGTPDLAFDKQDHIYSMNKNQRGLFIEKYDSSGSFVHKISELDSTNRNIMRRAIIGNNILVADGNLFFKNLSKPNLYEYNLSGKLLNTFSEKPGYYKEPEQDISSLEQSGQRILSQNIFDFARKYTANYSLHHLDEELILIQYVNMGENYGHQILTTDGEYILDYDLQTNNKIMAAKNGYVYTITENDSTTPTINEFEFIR